MNVCNILNFVPLYIEDRKGRKQKITIVRKRKYLFNELPFEGKIHLLLSRNKKALSVNELCKKIGIKKRTARKCLSKLEGKELIGRKIGTSINKNFRFGDKWFVIKKV